MGHAGHAVAPGVTYLFCGLLVLGRALLGAPAAGFGTSWLAAFVLVPASFLPVLPLWYRWVDGRFGRHPRAFRIAAEVAFAVEVIGFLLARGLV